MDSIRPLPIHESIWNTIQAITSSSPAIPNEFLEMESRQDEDISNLNIELSQLQSKNEHQEKIYKIMRKGIGNLDTITTNMESKRNQVHEVLNLFIKHCETFSIES